MTTRTTTHPRSTKKAWKLKRWPSLRFLVTVGFFLLIGNNIWTGSSCSLDVGPFEIACPLGVAQVLAASRSFIPKLVAAGVFGFLLVVFTGRAFCGWICPGRWIFNRGPTTNSKPWKYRAWTQRLIVGGVIGAAWVCHTPVFCVICPAGVVCRGAIATGTGGSLLPTAGWFTALVGAEWATGHSFCRDFCPLGAAFSRISRLNPFLKIKKKPDLCHPCIACQRVCPENLNLSKDTDLSTCTKCLACIDACPHGAVELKILDQLR